MRYCADTWFFIELSKNERRALEIIRALGKHKNRIIIPAVVLLELRRISIRSGKKELSNDFIKSLELNKNFEIINCDLEVSIKAGEISANYNIPAIDSIIVASAIVNSTNSTSNASINFFLIFFDNPALVKIIFSFALQ